MTTQLRPAQGQILQYESGTMGIAAVPGSGKTWTLSRLAVSLIQNGRLHDGQEVLIVTLVHSAVDNFRKRIAEFLEQAGLLPGLGYRVRTLHSLAHEIVSQVPGSIGLASDFSVVDERIADSILGGAFAASYPRAQRELEAYLIEDINDFRRQRILQDDLPGLLRNAIRNAVSHLKNRRISPAELRDKVKADSPVLARLAADVYERYQHGLDTRGALDFEDLITSAIRVLEADDTLVEGLRTRWPFILEDEAQDSSALQESILRKLIGAKGNWVRVGDPNQAIYETFTTAHPRYLRLFLEEAKAQRHLPNSGRSGLPIIQLANELIRWVREEHPVEGQRNALSMPYIEPTPTGDPQPNPPSQECQVLFSFAGDTPEQELDQVLASIQQWLPHNGDSTVVILVPTNSQGAHVIQMLQERGIPFCDALLRLTTSTREAAGALSLILQHLAHPESARTLIVAYRVWFHRVLREADSEDGQSRLESHLQLLKHCTLPEKFIWPSAGEDPLGFLPAGSLNADLKSCLDRFRAQVQHWHSLVMLPIAELLTAIAQDLFREPDKLAMTQLFGEILRERSEYHLGSRRRLADLDDLRSELVVIARDRRQLRSIEADKSGFDPDAHTGEVVVATVHGAKGLEWDRVYLLSISDYDFPSGAPGEPFRSERWYIRDNLSLEAEILAQLDVISDQMDYREGAATGEARSDYASERLRLLYVGLTRARRELVVSGNVGLKGKNQPALSFIALQKYLNGQNA